MAILQRSFGATYMKVLPHAATNIHVQHGIKFCYKVTKLENKLFELKLFVVALRCRLNAFSLLSLRF